ncbi:MAG: hypothetical protein OHK0048_21610 [Rhodoferax sp.]
MPIAAVPAYLGQDFKDASPGMRFGMYLPLWGVNQRTRELLWTTHDLKYEVRGQAHQEREVKEENKTSALRAATALSPRDKAIFASLLARQNASFLTAAPEAARFGLEASAVAPFTTGLGNEHPLENGFAFLNPYGLPYLPGSGVKGVLRQAVRELASGQWGDTQGWTAEKIHTIGQGKNAIELSPIDALFGLEASEGSTELVRGALTFWDVIPQIKGDALAVDIMTPHQSHYYQQNSERKSGNSVTPHESGQPNPISFLTVPPGSTFSFHVTCDLDHLNRLAPDLAANDRWKVLLTAAFAHAFEWLGFGAKTAVGYGAMQAQAASAQAWPGARIKFNRANGTLTAERGGQQVHATAPKGEALLSALPAPLQAKIKRNEFVKATAWVAGSSLVKVDP